MKNINALRDVDNDPGFYCAACAADPNATNWRGATLFVSADSGATYEQVATLTVETTMGVTTNALANFGGGSFLVDELSSVNVRLSHGTLSSTTLEGLLAGVNACVIGEEIIAFRDATLESDGTYTLRGFLRGRRGSEYAMGGHAIGDRFVLASVAAGGTITRIAQATADIGIPKKWKAVTSGMTLASATERDFTNEATGLKPYAPVQLGGGRVASGDLTLTWIRRNRISGEWRDAVDVPNSEAGESYEVEILNGATVVRTITGLTSPTASYTAAQQTTDFGAPQASVAFRVYQLSAIVGRGHAATGTV